MAAGFAAAYNALDFRIYMWGGHAVTHDTGLYLGLAYGHWFVYPPFAAALDPVYQTLFLGQVNLFLLALVVTDVWLVSRGAGLAGLGVGVAGAVKLTPAIFIVFFLLAGKTKAALMSAAAFAGCGLVALLVAPGASARCWEHLC